MTSTLQPIITQITTDIETTSVETAIYGEGKVGDYPNVRFSFGDGELEIFHNAQLDRTCEMTMFITAQNRDQVDQALEELMKLYMDNTVMAVVNDLGVIEIRPVIITSPFELESKIEFGGAITWAVVIRYAYP